MNTRTKVGPHGSVSIDILLDLGNHSNTTHRFGYNQQHIVVLYQFANLGSMLVYW